MRVLLCHTYYTQRGGEDCCFEEERDLLRSHGVETAEYVRRNDELLTSHRLSVAAKTLWNRQAGRDVAAAVRRHRADVVHMTNTFPLLSPAVCWAAARSGAAVVQALHNYRWLCAGAYLMRDGRPCEDCVGRSVAWPAVLHGCYRNSSAASAVAAAMQLVHRLRDWRGVVDAFFTPSRFARERFVEAGFPADRVHVKYNSVADPGPPSFSRERYVAFIGRLSPEKGVEVLLDAWRRDAKLPQLRIAGDGPLAAQVQAAADTDPRIELLGQLPTERVQRLLAGAAVMVMPSLWYETFGRTIAEAYAAGTPVIVSRLGAMAELVEEGRTGWRFQAGDAEGLAACTRRAVAMADAELDAMRTAARASYERQFKPEQNFQRMIEIYEAAIEHAQLRRRGAAATRAFEPPLSVRSSAAHQL